MAEKKATLYLNCIIEENEPIEIVKRSIESIKDGVDGMYLTITHKDKEPKNEQKLVELLTSYGAHISFFKWTYSFAEARQFALSQVPKGPEIFIVWIDADDVFVGVEKLHQIADEMVANFEVAIYLDYWYQVDLDKNGDVREILVQHKRERIIKNDDTWKWIGSLHETLIEQKQENLIRHFRKECHVIHLTNGERLDKNIERNVEILEASAKAEQHKDPRTIIYLAKAYFDKAKMTQDEGQRKIFLDLALNLFNEYLSGAGKPGTPGYQKPSGWPEERSTAWAYIGEIAVLSGHPEAAIGAYQNAIDEAPYFPEYYIDMATCYVMLNNFKKAEHWLNVGTSVPEPDTTIIQFPRERKTRALEASFHINMNKNKLDWALQDAEKLLKIIPEDVLAQGRVKHVASLVAYNKACQSIVYLGKYLEQIKEADKIPALLQALSSDMHQERFAAQMKHRFIAPRIWEKDEITIVCGPGFEKWDANSVQTGLGGSEEAVVYMSQELTKLGWRVTVYGSPAKPGDFGGVQYKVWHDLNPKDQFNTLILWRSIGFVDVNPVSRFTLLWLHDIPNNPDFTEERVNKIDKIAVLSEYHKSLLRLHKNGLFSPMPENKIFVTSNGIPSLLVKEWKGTPHRIIYASSYDRGLVYLLKNWSKVREEVRNAELHIFYGWEIYDLIHKNNPAKAQWKNDILKNMKQDGIVCHGRVGHNALNAEFAKSGIFAFPTDFQEISCINAMRAQACGAIPVVTNFAALQETVKNGIKVDVDITTSEGQAEYFEALVDLLKDEKKQQEIRPKMMTWAQKYFAWNNVALIWSELLNIKLQNPEYKNYESNIPAEKDTTSDRRPAKMQEDIIRPLPRGNNKRKQGQSITNPAKDNGGNGNAK